MKRLALVALTLMLAGAAFAQGPNGARVLRVQRPADVETLDPARAPELGTVNALAPLYHQLPTYDYGSLPVRFIPYAAEALPQISADRRTYVLKVRPGLLFSPHPAFGGKPRELVADPAYSSMSFLSLEGVIEGLNDAVDRARREAKPFDYAATIAGLRATDRYTLEMRLTQPDPTFVYNLAYGGLSAVPREVVAAEGGCRVPGWAIWDGGRTMAGTN